MKSTVLLLLLLTFSLPTFASFDDKEKPLTRLLTGQVVAENGEPLPAASITIVETGDTYFADLDGKFNFTVPLDRTYTVEISTIGFEVLKVNTKNILPFSQQVLPVLP
jgi:hypothetical protein